MTYIIYRSGSDIGPKTARSLIDMNATRKKFTNKFEEKNLEAGFAAYCIVSNVEK